MKNRSVSFLRASLAAACLLAACPWPATAYIKFVPPTLGDLCRQATHIVVLQVEKVSAERGVILFKSVAELKVQGVLPDGALAKQVIRPNVTGAAITGPNGAKVILDWAAEGKTAVLFAKIDIESKKPGTASPERILMGGNVRAHVYIDGYWYWIAYDGNSKCWAAVNGEPTLLTRYCGPADKLGDAVAKMLRGEEVVVPAMVGDNTRDLEQGRAKVQDLRASLEILDGDKKPVAKKPQPDGKQADGKKPGDKPADDKKPEDKKPGDPKKPGDKPADDKLADDKKPEDKKPGDKPADKPDDKKPGDKPADDKKPGDKPADDKKPEDKKPADDKKPEKPADSKPVDDKKPDKPADAKKPGDTKKAEGNKPEAPRAVYPLPTRDPLPTIAAIDREIDRRLADAKVPASPRADDAEFLRRVTLDLSGRIPTLERTRAFLDSSDPDKRRKLIDELLSSPEFGQHFATIWRNLMAARETGEKRTGGDSFSPWLTEQFNSRRGWNEIVYDLLTAEGEARTTPQAAFILANSEMGQPRPNLIAASATRLFLGVQLQCAECHNHPFTSWKQADFWATAAFFSRVRNGGNKGGPLTLTEVLDTAAPGKKEIGGLKVTGDGGIVIPGSAGSNAGQVVKARFLDGEQPVLDDKPLRPRFATWATSADNKYFAPAFVNRVWGQFFGRGFFNPVDNFRDDQPASHPELLKLLADEFKASGHDAKHLVRCLCNTQAYQRTSKPLADNEADAELFSHMTVKVLSSEAFLDSLFIVTKSQGGGKPVSRDQFLAGFRTPEGAEGEFGHGIPQFLRRLNAQEFNGRFALVDQLAASGQSRDQVIESLYLAALSRRPNTDELRLMTDYLAKRNNPAGVLWILLNSGEFILNH